jgi:hypothetical protein
MRKQLITAIAILACTATQVHATEYQFVAEDHSPATRLCIAAGEGDVDGLRFQIRKLRQSPHHQYKAIVNSIRCNGQVVAQFANVYGAQDTYEYLYRLTTKENRKKVGRTSVEDVVLERPDVSTADVIVVRVSGR